MVCSIKLIWLFWFGLIVLWMLKCFWLAFCFVKLAISSTGFNRKLLVVFSKMRWHSILCNSVTSSSRGILKFQIIIRLCRTGSETLFLENWLLCYWMWTCHCRNFLMIILSNCDKAVYFAEIASHCWWIYGKSPTSSGSLEEDWLGYNIF